MSETTDTATAGEQIETVDEAKTFTQDELNEIVEKRLARERAKFGDVEALRAKASKLDELEESKKTELQKLQDKLTAAQSALTAKEQEAARLKVIADHGVPSDYQDLVRGSTAEELAASAEKVAKLLTAAQGSGKFILSTEGKQPKIPSSSSDDWLRDKFRKR